MKDTLHLYYKDIYFSKDTLLHPEVDSASFGIAGEPVPYVVGNDSLIVALLLSCLVLTLFAWKWRAKVLMMVQACLLFSLFLFFYAKEHVAASFVLHSDYLLILIFMAMLTGYVLLKGLLYTIVNNVFFDGKRNVHFLSSMMTAAAWQGVALLPVALLYVFLGLSLQNVLYCCIFVVIIGKIWAFYRSFSIFFCQNGGFLQNILYFCALEIVPLAALVGTWMLVVDLLKINF